MKSIIQAADCCYFCGTSQNLHTHHVFFGLKNKSISDKYGFIVRLCLYHHNGGGNGKCVHQCREMDLELKRLCQEKFEETHTRDEFMALIGRNYLD